MMKHRTGTSSSYGPPDDAAPRDVIAAGPEATSKSGLVLLFAPHFDEFQPAYVFAAPELIIGRDAAASVCVPEQAVSRHHARIAYVPSLPGHPPGGRWVITDLQSRNGTMVNGSFITEMPLEHGHEIRIGDAVFKFVESGAERYVRYRLDGRVNGERLAKKTLELVGGCEMDRIAADIERIGPTELSCVIMGETGTGKEVVARELHRASNRKASFQAINCAAIPHNLLESELFGYRRGAFSGADRDKPGLIKLADGGTLFLDEIGDMPLEAQAKLLRVLQSREVFPLGATTPERVDIRVICATHRDLYQFVGAGRFRGDLFARLNEHAVKLPPLRARKEDIYQLAKSFAGKYAAPDLDFTFSFVVALLHYNWPFNVRELESCIKRGVALSDGTPLDTRQLPDAIAEHMRGYGVRDRIGMPSLMPPPLPEPGHSATPKPPPPDAKAARAPTEEELRGLLARHKGNVAAVGRELGKERMQVHRWLKKYDIRLEDYR
jgi:transcriptional regulator with GAF, ATPase, and Fis domain